MEQVMRVAVVVIARAPPCVAQDMQNARNICVLWDIQLRPRPGQRDERAERCCQETPCDAAAAAAQSRWRAGACLQPSSPGPARRCSSLVSHRRVPVCHLRSPVTAPSPPRRHAHSPGKAPSSWSSSVLSHDHHLGEKIDRERASKCELTSRYDVAGNRPGAVPVRVRPAAARAMVRVHRAWVGDAPARLAWSRPSSRRCVPRVESWQNGTRAPGMV